jgi:hypothetical protein
VDIATSLDGFIAMADGGIDWLNEPPNPDKSDYGYAEFISGKMMLTGKWKQPGVWNTEQFDPDPFMEALNKYGLPWKILEGKTLES